MDVRALVGARPTGTAISQVALGYVSYNRDAPATLDDPLWVIIPSHGTDVVYGPFDWPANHNSLLPQGGDTVLVAFDERNHAHVAAWYTDRSDPGTGAPSGAAGGDLSGTYPAPTVASVLGGQTPVVSTDTRLTNSRTPTGGAAGDLAGTYPNPTVKASVGLTGTPTAPTAASGTSTTQIASTAFVQAAILGTQTFVNVAAHGIVPGTVTLSAISTLIGALPAGAACLYFPAGEYDFNNSAAHAITAVDGLVILGDGRSTILKGTGAGGFALINATGTVRCEVRYCQLQGTAGAGRSDGIKHSGTAPGGYVADHVYFNGFSYAVFFPGYTGTDDFLVTTHNKNAFIEVTDCEIQGQVTAYPSASGTTSDGITHQAASGRVRISRTSIHHVGKDSDFHHHAVYLARGCDTIIENLTVDYVVGGRAIQFEDQIADYPTNGVAPYHQLVANSTFGSNFAGTNEGQAILTSSALSTTEVIGCKINTPKKGIELRGKFLIADCIFNQSDTGFPSVYTNDVLDTQSFPTNTYHTAAGTLRGCRWIGSSLYDVQVLTQNGIVNDITLDGCHHLGGTTDAYVKVESPADSSSVWIRGGRFSGSGALVATVWADAGFLVAVDDSQMFPSNAGVKAVRCGPTAAPGTLRLRRNNLSQGGSSVVFDQIPVTFEHEANYGSKGYKSENGGVTNVADGGMIDLGLGSGGSYPAQNLRATGCAGTVGQIATGFVCQQYSSELNPNTGVETVLAPWTTSTATANTFARVATPGGFTGNASSWVARFQYSSTGPDFAQVLSEFGATGHAVTAGLYYQAFGNIYVPTNAAAGFRIGVRWWNGGTNISSSVTPGAAQTGTGVWSKTGIFQAPPTATRAAVVFQWTTVNGDVIDAYVDNLSLRATGSFAVVNLRLHDGTTPVGAQPVNWEGHSS